MIPKTKDNAQGQLSAGISASSLSLSLGSGEGAIFPVTINGSVTSAGSSTVLNSTGIQADGVAVGDYIENLTDGSHAFVVSVSTDSVVTSTLKGGSDNTWQSSDEWAVGRFVCTINTRDGDGIIDASEKILVKQRVGDVFTISSRGYDGSSSQVWGTGAYISLFPVSKHFEGIKSAVAELASDIKSLQDTRATITYVDALVTGMKFKDSVVAATTANVTLSTDVEDGDTLDEVTLATGDRILVKDQSTASENGVYIVASSGSPTRATDFDESAEVTQAVVPVESGTVNADKLFYQIENSPVIDTDDLTFNQLPDVATFVGLSDTPSSFSGEGGKSVRVNSGETALEFVNYYEPAHNFGNSIRTSIGVQTITHGLGEIPTTIKITAKGPTVTPAGGQASFGIWKTGGTYSCVGMNSYGDTTQSSSSILSVDCNGIYVVQGTISNVTTTQFDITWSGDFDNHTVYFLWEAQNS